MDFIFWACSKFTIPLIILFLLIFLIRFLSKTQFQDGVFFGSQSSRGFSRETQIQNRLTKTSESHFRRLYIEEMIEFEVSQALFRKFDGLPNKAVPEQATPK